MAKLGNTESVASVPGIEASDLNDGDIISATRKLTDDGGKTVMFAYTLPSGQEMRSDPVLQEHVGKAIFGWLDAVRQTIVEESSAKQEQALIAQRESQWSSMAVDTSGKNVTDADLRSAGVSLPRDQPRREDYVDTPLPSDAKGYTKAKLKEAKELVSILRQQITSRQKALKVAEKSVEHWTIAVRALRGS